MTNEELIADYKGGNASALETIISANNGLILKACSKFYIKDAAIDKDDLFQEGVIGLIKAINGYSLEGGAIFSTYAFKCIWASIHRFVLGRGYRKGYEDISLVSIDAPIGNQADGLSLGDTICNDTGIENDDMLLDVPNVYTDMLAAIDDFLTPRQASVLKLKYGLDCNQLTSGDIARMLGVQPQRVSQIESNAFSKLRRSSWGLKYLSDYIVDHRESVARPDSIIGIVNFEKKHSSEIMAIKSMGLDIDLSTLSSIYS